MIKQQSLQNKIDNGNQHAIVIGASMAGLLAARVLSDYFEQVTIIERDRLPQEAMARKGVPQGQHIHVLLAKGQAILSEYFPGLFEQLAQDGAVSFAGADLHWYHFGGWKLPFSNPVESSSESRPFLEQHVREFLAARGNVRFLDGHEVVKLSTSKGLDKITGVFVRDRNAEHAGAEEMVADLVVDASGRGSRTPQWLAALGYEKVEETRVKVDVGYATRVYRRPANLPVDWKLLLVYSMAPEKRTGIVSLIEDDRWIVTLTSRAGDYPPTDEEGFLEFARSLPQPDLYEAIKEAEPLTPIVAYKYSANRWRHYERMARLPEGFIIMGDAACSFNPTYGQGMTVAAIEAKILDDCLRQQPPVSKKQKDFALPFQKAIASAIAAPWQLTTGEDFRYAETEGRRPFGIHLLNWYGLRLSQLALSNQLAANRFYEATQMLKPATVLFDPRLVWAVLLKELEVRRYKRVAPNEQKLLTRTQPLRVSTSR